MARQLAHASPEVARLKVHDRLGVHVIGMRRPVAVAGCGLPPGIAAVWSSCMACAIAAAGMMREGHLADLSQQVAEVND